MRLAPRSLVIPLIQTLAIETGIYLFDRFVLEKDFSQVTPSDLWINIRDGWRFDADDIFVNYLGHPYHGTLVYGAARSSDLTFWESLPFSLGGAFLWELSAEKIEPSINDLINSGVTGAIMGEAFHRVAHLLIVAEPEPNILTGLGAFVLEPFGAFNRAVFGEGIPLSLLEKPPEWRGRVYAGGLLITGNQVEQREQGVAALDFTYGFPDKPQGCFDPLEHFDLTGMFGLGEGAKTTDVFLRGIIAGCRFGRPGSTGAWGLWTLSDFLTGPGYRLADLGFGPGGALELRPTARSKLRLAAAASAVIAGSGPQFLTDVNLKGTDRGTELLYPVQYGFQGMGDVELSLPLATSLRFTGRVWQLFDAAPEDHMSTFGMMSFTFNAPTLWYVAPSARFNWQHRNGFPSYPGDRGWLSMVLISVPFGAWWPQGRTAGSLLTQE